MLLILQVEVILYSYLYEEPELFVKNVDELIKLGRKFNVMIMNEILMIGSIKEQLGSGC